MRLISSSLSRLRMQSESSNSLDSATSGLNSSVLSRAASPTSTAATSALEEDDYDIIQGLYIRKDAGMEPSTRQAYESILLPLINQELVHSTYAERYSITLCSVGFRSTAFSPAILISTPTPRAKKKIFAHLAGLTELKVALKEHNLGLHVVAHHIRLSGGSKAQLGDDGRLPYVVPRPGSNALCGSKIVIPRSGHMESSSCTSGLTFTIGGREYGKTALHPWEDSVDAVADTDLESSPSDDEDDETDDGLALSLFPDGPHPLDESDASSSSFSDCSTDSLTPLPQAHMPASHISNTVANANESAPNVRRGLSTVNPIYEGPQTDWLLYDAQEAAPDIALSELIRNEVDGYKITKFYHEDPDAKVPVAISDHEATVYGYIQPGAVSYRSGSRVYNMRLVTLEYPLRPGCSGAAVTHQDELCGTIQVISEDVPWAYMVPIEAELKEMEAVCGLPVRLSGAEEKSFVEPDNRAGTMSSAAFARPSRPPSVAHEDHIQFFHSKLDEFTVRPKNRDDWKGKNFILRRKLREWLNGSASKSQDSNVAILLESAYREWKHPVTPINVKQMTEGTSPCLLTFCILLELGEGSFLHLFQRCDIVDAALPLRLSVLQERVRNALKDTGRSAPDLDREAVQLARRFDKAQWKYKAVRFKLNNSKDYGSPDVLPFIDRKLITGKGATAKVYEVAIPDVFLDEGLKLRSPSPAEHPDFPELGPVHRFAVKVFKDGHRHLWEDETNAYKNLDSNNGMVKYLGDFTHEADGQYTHNILLEYAESDLDEYFYRSPPVVTDHIQKFWKNLLHVVVAIKGLHVFEARRLKSAKLTKYKGLSKYKGCHADIKPDNILLVRGRFKLADPGFARFQKLQDEIEGRQHGPEVHGGTSKYSAPERFRQDIQSIDRAKCDIWSLGCVFSEAATWIVLGRTGIRQFSALRRNAVSKLREYDAGLENSAVKHLNSSDCFHNGRSVLKEVMEWHNFLRTILRPTDNTTSSILDMIDRHIFLADPEERFDAKQIDQWWNEQNYALKPCPVSVSKVIEQLLLDTTQYEAQEILQGLGSQDIEERRAAKSSKSFLQIPLVDRSAPSSSASRRPSASDKNDQRGPLSAPSPGYSGLWTPSESNGDIRRQSASTDEPILGLNLAGSHTDSRRHSVFDAYYHHLWERGKHHGMLKSISMPKDDRQKKGDRLAKAIADRDLIFLVDNGSSMLEHWSEARFLLEILVTKTWNIDPDGVELTFTNGPIHIQAGGKKKERDLEELKKAMNHPEAKPTQSRTDMSDKLSRILFRWLNDFKRTQQQRKRLTIIVLTDGKWEGMASKPRDVDDMIVQFHGRLREVVGTFQPKRLVSISFISFGHDPDAIYRLRRLDNDLGYRGVPNIVNTEPSDGDVYQMLLGSISDDHDHRNDPPGASRERSPPTPHGQYSFLLY